MGDVLGDPLSRLPAIRTAMTAGTTICEYDVQQLLNKLREILYTEDTLLCLRSPIVICGDVHGQYEDVQYLLTRAMKATAEGFEDSRRILFMGDYVDRGKFSLNTFLLLVTYKLQYPQCVFLLRGNHESRQITQTYGFHAEILTRYGHPGLWTLTMHCFDLLPIAALIDTDVFSVHGGISPSLPFTERINLIERRVEIPDAGLLADLTWSDPEPTLKTAWRKNSRGAGWIFGREAVEKFTNLNRIKCITRSHQLAREGFEWPFAPTGHGREGALPGKLVNVWSAPNYAYKEGNLASFLKLRCHNPEDGDTVYGDFALVRPYEAVPPAKRIQQENDRPDNRYFA
jgi:diadenosine tetraphosphatase ApaH/serine/threonine PP2A family protein phosphatase